MNNADGITIRYAATDSISSILDLEKKWKDEGLDKDMNPYTADEIGSAIREKRLIIAKKDGKIIGFLNFEIDKKGKKCELDAIYVDKGYRENQVGRLLMDHFMDDKRVASCEKVYLLADSVDEDRLVRFYQGYGFKKVAVKMLRQNKPDKRI